PEYSSGFKFSFVLIQLECHLPESNDKYKLIALHFYANFTIICPPSPDSCRLTLDPNTANRNLRLSEFNRVVTWEGCMQPYADHPERFNSNGQVLCTEGLTGCCYWEVEWSGQQFGIALAYKGIGRQEGSNDSMYGQNDKSWCFKYNPGGYYSYNYSFCHNNETIQVQTTFTEPLYPGIYLYGGTAKLC
uniref:B30.2/SPRY domain-containing protein n=1 Tax=Paramormyrops kingsleyae TaxID=1676925 RepID=A0A3B3T7M9_9TELE